MGVTHDGPTSSINKENPNLLDKKYLKECMSYIKYQQKRTLLSIGNPWLLCLVDAAIFALYLKLKLLN